MTQTDTENGQTAFSLTDTLPDVAKRLRVGGGGGGQRASYSENEVALATALIDGKVATVPLQGDSVVARKGHFDNLKRRMRAALKSMGHGPDDSEPLYVAAFVDNERIEHAILEATTEPQRRSGVPAI